MKKLYAGLLAVLVLVGCTPTGPGVQPTPTPIVVPESTPGPVASATPSQEALSAEAERVYRTFFNEWKRLEREGGADEPTQILKDNGAEDYVEAITLLLQSFKARGIRYEGAAPELKIVPAPGENLDRPQVDPRLTIRVCEDYRGGWNVNPTGSSEGILVEGKVYLGFIEGRMKVIWSTTEEVAECSL